jgi:hypothetical protein
MLYPHAEAAETHRGGRRQAVGRARRAWRQTMGERGWRAQRAPSRAPQTGGTTGTDITFTSTFTGNGYQGLTDVEERSRVREERRCHGPVKSEMSMGRGC